MPYDDLRQFLNLLEENGQLVRIKDLVLPEPDVTAAAHAALRLRSGAPALLFENIRGYKNQLTLNVHGSWANHALMLGMPKDATILLIRQPLSCRFWRSRRKHGLASCGPGV